MQHLFQAWADFAANARAASRLLLLADYDGTLTLIVSRPQEAVLSPQLRESLTILSRKPAVHSGIISGRSLTEIKALVRIEGLYYAGNHGLEIEGPGIDFVHPVAEANRGLMKALAHELGQKLADIEGVIVEDKGLSLSVHYRLVKRGEEVRVAGIFRQTMAPWLRDGKIRVTSGKKVWEVRPPVDWHKGKAVQTIIEKTRVLLGKEGWLVIYLGDDVTDEDVFRIIHRPEGWSILVGRENPALKAEYFLNSTDEVATFLSRLEEGC